MPKVKILIVEDEFLIAEDLRLLIERMGFAVAGVASSGHCAIRKAGELHPDLILMDVRLHGSMDGIEAGRIIRSKADIPIIFVTAHAAALASSEFMDRCYFLAKPFSPPQLQKALHAVLNESSAQ